MSDPYGGFRFADDAGYMAVVSEDDELVCLVDAGDSVGEILDRIRTWSDDAEPV